MFLILDQPSTPGSEGEGVSLVNRAQKCRKITRLLHKKKEWVQMSPKHWMADTIFVYPTAIPPLLPLRLQDPKADDKLTFLLFGCNTFFIYFLFSLLTF